MSSLISQDQVQRFAAIFAGRVSAFGRMFIDDKGHKTVKTYNEPPPTDAYQKHLEGDGPFFGVIMIREDDTCFFGAIDVDDDGIDLYELEAKVTAHNLPLVVCRSRSGGAHLYCFLREAVSAKLLIEALKKFRTVLGHEKNSNGTVTEIFPKQAKVPIGGTGNWINIPYFDADNTNRYAVVGQRQLTLSEFLEHAVNRSVSEHGLLEWADPALGPFKDGPPCLQELHKRDFPEGGRNNALLNVGIFFRMQQPSGWEEMLQSYNHEMESPLDDKEIGQIVRNLERHTEYSYTCKNHPIEALCQRKQCKKQEFGIGWFSKKKRLDAMPELASLIKITSEPPRYRVAVNGVQIDCSLDEIYSPALFKKLCLAKLNLVVGKPKEFEWDELVRELLETMIEEPAPEDPLRLNLRDFLATRHKSDSVDDVLLNKAALENHRVYFRGTDFATWLRKRDIRRDYNELYTTLMRTEGLTTERRKLKGADTELWSVPEPNDDQSEPFTHPAITSTRAY